MSKIKEKPKNDVDLAYELKTLVSAWVQEFNFIQIDVLQLVAQHNNQELWECIRGKELGWEDLAEYTGDTVEFLEQEYSDPEDHPSFERMQEEDRDRNYPMWNTCFEFKQSESEDVIQAAIDAGIGVIEGLGDFNPILFFSGCGYSFYGSHWIPMFLNLPWNKELKKKYAGVKYSNM